MIARKYQPSDFPQIKEWGSQYGANYREHQFPKTGFIVDGLAAYFLYSTDSSVCWLENMISNKNADKINKNLALALITESILKEARKLRFKVAYATTDNLSVVGRALKAGAKLEKTSQFLLTKDLGPSL